MLCSVSSAGSKSGSNWLDRLRSAKGFPVADNLDLDHFLSNTSSLPDPESTQSHNERVTSNQTQVPRSSSQIKEKELVSAVTNVLCDLFNMGDSHDLNSRFSGKRSGRKQTNPRFFDIDIGRREEDALQAAITTTSFHSDNNSNVAGLNGDCYGEDYDEDDDEKEKCTSDKELKGYSKSEVTVIDTSFEVWKFDSLVFRKKNIWKVRDKKVKPWNFGSKKRKGSHSDSANANGKCKKKANLSNSEFASSKESSGEGCELESNENQNPQDEKKEELCKSVFDDHLRVPRKRIHFSRFPRKLKKNCSSVVLIKAIPTSKKCGKNLPKDRHKDCQKQQSKA